MPIPRPAYVCDHVAGKITFAPQLRQSDERGSPRRRSLSAACPRRVRGSRRVRNGRRSSGQRRRGKPDDAEGSGCRRNARGHQYGRRVRRPQQRNAGQRAARGPREFHALQRAVTARDFELIADETASVARARAYPKHELWNYADPGTVAVLLVPGVFWKSARDTGAVTAAALESVQTEDTLEASARRSTPPSTWDQCDVDWVRYKTVKVKADVVVALGENAAAVQGRIVESCTRSSIRCRPTDARLALRTAAARLGCHQPDIGGAGRRLLSRRRADRRRRTVDRRSRALRRSDREQPLVRHERREPLPLAGRRG